MTEGTQPRMARGTKLTAALAAAALFALLAFAPFASAAPDPVASGSATVTLKKSFTNYLKTFGIKVQKISPAKLKGQKATFTVTGGSMDPTTGAGTLTLGGGLKFKAGKKSATVKALVIDTTKKSLTGKVSGKKVKLASLGGSSFTRSGFGVSLTVKKLKLTGAAAKQLNKKTGYAKGKPKPFLGNKLIASSKGEEQPATVTLLPANNIVYDANVELLKKLKDVEVNIETIAPTATKGPTTFEFPISGGNIAPAATAGVVNSSGGVKLRQKLPLPEGKFIETEITLANFWTDLSAHTVSVEVTAESNAESPAGSGKFPLKLGALGRSSIANLSLTGATVVSDPVNRKVTVQNASATLQPVAAEVLNGFVQVYKAYVEGGTYAAVFKKAKEEGATDEQADAAGKAAAKEAGEAVAKNEIKENDPLGNFSFTAQTQ
ncbi:MAG TPA: hypothetical protein VFS64_09005 [Solirubrobacterales bacterium]|nr:hypothetical protein [Solirubrobacterales bacterium]